MQLFPNASFTVGDINDSALDFCRKTFLANTFESRTSFAEISLDNRFDLIWCGSLITHLDEQSAIELLGFFYAHLGEGGLCVVTTHGARTIDWIETGQYFYGLSEVSRREIVDKFKLGEYAYADYPNQKGYGISAVPAGRFLALADSIGDWSNCMFRDHGVDNHQDVYAFAK
jgi:hypothetical protein